MNQETLQKSKWLIPVGIIAVIVFIISVIIMIVYMDRNELLSYLMIIPLYISLVFSFGIGMLTLCKPENFKLLFHGITAIITFGFSIYGVLSIIKNGQWAFIVLPIIGILISCVLYGVCFLECIVCIRN